MDCRPLLLEKPVAATILTLQFDDVQAQRVLLDSLRILKAGAEGPMRPFFRRAAARYLGFIRRRFVNASRGDGTWPDLALSTKLKRLRRQHRGRFSRFVKKQEGKNRAAQMMALANSSKFAILRDTSTLFGALTEGNLGNEIDYGKDGVVIGVNVRYARFHQDPAILGRPPKREILVQPDKQTEEQMAIELANGILAAYDETPELAQGAGDGGV